MTGDLVSTTRLPPSIPLKPEHVTAVGIADDNCSAFAGLWDGSLCVIDLIRGRELFRFHAHSKVITSVAQAPNSGEVLTSSIDPDIGGDNQFIRVWKLIDLETAPCPDKSDEWWARHAMDTFLKRHGDGADLSRGFRRTDELGLYLGTENDETPQTNDLPDPGSTPDLGSLRAALFAEPRSAERNLEMAYLSSNDRGKAQDYLIRVCRFGGEHLIQDPEVACIIAEHMLKEGRTDQAVPWLTRAADQDNADALLQLGLLSMSGEGMPRNERQGAEFFKRSAIGGNAVAAYNLGAYYEHVESTFLAQTDWRQIAFGKPVSRPSDGLVQAFDWYRQAAEADYAPAQDRLGDSFADGQVVGRDVAMAKVWYGRAAAQGHEEADTKRSALDDDTP